MSKFSGLITEPISIERSKLMVETSGLASALKNSARVETGTVSP